MNIITGWLACQQGDRRRTDRRTALSCNDRVISGSASTFAGSMSLPAQTRVKGTKNMSQPNLYVDVANPASAPISVQLGQALVFIRRRSCGRFLHRLDLSASHFTAQPIVNHGMTPLPGQPSGTYIVAVGIAQQKGSGNILVQFALPNAMHSPDEPSSLPFTVN